MTTTPWRLAAALDKLRAQVNTAHPKRSKKSDGAIGDVAHAATTSDHNPVAGVVHALDLTNDPAKGLVVSALADALVASRDPRLDYVISAGRIASSTVSPWTWRRYTGANPHTTHVHVSVVDGPAADDTRPWRLDGGQARLAYPAFPGTVRAGTRGTATRQVQARLAARGWAITVDGIAGPKTVAAIRAFQKDKGLKPVDGIAGPATWAALWTAKVTR